MSSRIVLASNNLGKLKEFQQLFAKYQIEVTPQADFNVPEVDEPYQTFIENSLHKARHCSAYTNLPALADDSGLCVNNLNNEPGIHSARYAGVPSSASANMDKLLSSLQSCTNRQAYFYCSLVYIRHKLDPQPIIAEGVFHGEINSAPRGDNGHGYDPIFYLAQYNATVAELSDVIKNQISHRALASIELINKLQAAQIII